MVVKQPIGWLPPDDVWCPSWRVDGPGDGVWMAFEFWPGLSEDYNTEDYVTLRYGDRGAFMRTEIAKEMWVDAPQEGLRWIMQSMVDQLNRCVDRGWFDLVKHDRL